MSKIRFDSIVILSVLMLTACAPSENAIQTAIAQTQGVIPTFTTTLISTNTFTATSPDTPTPTITITPTETLTPTPSLTQTETLTPTPSLTPTASATSTKTPSLTPTKDLGLHLTLIEFINHYDNLTDLQKKEYLLQLPGKTVDWSGRVIDVDNDGDILVEIPGTLISAISLKGIPLETAITIDKDSTIRFKGVIEDVIDFLGLHIYIIEVEIVK